MYNKGEYMLSVVLVGANYEQEDVWFRQCFLGPGIELQKLNRWIQEKTIAIFHGEKVLKKCRDEIKTQLNQLKILHGIRRTHYRE